MVLFLLPYSTRITISSGIVTNLCSFLPSNGSYWNKISHSHLRNADKPTIQSDSATPGKIHYGLSQSHVNSCCHQTRETQDSTACSSHAYQGEASTAAVMDRIQLWTQTLISDRWQMNSEHLTSIFTIFRSFGFLTEPWIKPRGGLGVMTVEQNTPH